MIRGVAAAPPPTGTHVLAGCVLECLHDRRDLPRPQRATDRIRTCDAGFRKPSLYPLSYGGGPKKTRGGVTCPRCSLIGRTLWCTVYALSSIPVTHLHGDVA